MAMLGDVSREVGEEVRVLLRTRGTVCPLRCGMNSWLGERLR